MSNEVFTEPAVWTRADIAAQAPTFTPVGAGAFPCAISPAKSEGVARKCSIVNGFADLKFQEDESKFGEEFCMEGGFRQAAGGAYGQHGGRYGGGFPGGGPSTRGGRTNYGGGGADGSGAYGPPAGGSSGGGGNFGGGGGGGKKPGGNTGGHSGQQQGSYNYANNTKPAKSDNKAAMAAVDAHAAKVILHGDDSKATPATTKNTPSSKDIESAKYKHGLRTSFGSKGAPAEIVTNYLDLTLPRRIYVYKLDMFRRYIGPAAPQNVAVSRMADKKLVVEEMRTSQGANRVPELQHIPRTWASDGDLLWSTTLLWPAVTTVGTRVHTMQNLSYINEMGQQLVLSDVSITFLHDIDLSGSMPSLFYAPTDHVPNESVPEVLTRGLNAFLTASVRGRTNITSVGSNKSFANVPGRFLSRGQQQASLRALTGFFISARPGVERLLININTTASPFFVKGTVANFITASLASGRSRSDIITALKGCKVRISYHTRVNFQSEPQRTRFITEVAVHRASATRTRNGQTVQAWYATNQQAADFPLPTIAIPGDSFCVNVGKASNIQNGSLVEWYPAQCLDIVEWHTYRARLTGAENTEMLRVACRTPQENVNQILGPGLQQFSFTNSLNQGGLSTFGNTHAGQHMLRIAARWLPTPIVRYQNANSAIENASWNLRKVKFASSSTITRLPLLNLSRQAVPQNFCTSMENALKTHGLLPNNSNIHFNIRTVAVPAVPTPLGVLDPTVATAIKNAFIAMGVPANVTVLVVIPQKEFDLYAVVKRVAELELGVKTVLCTASVAGKFNDQTASNLALKYNIKGMGDNHRLGATDIVPLRGNAASNGTIDTIVLGADVGHPGKGCSTAAPSVAGVVGSVDREFMLYPGSMRLQPSGQEYIQDLTDMVKERLLDWHNKNGKLPKRVLFYRDGVSESQYDAVRRSEIPQIQQAFNNAQTVIDTLAKAPIVHSDKSPDVPFELTFVVVGKRHNTRFYPLKAADSFTKGKGQVNGNVRPGLVVDQVITHPFVMDFYLQSHNPIQGTGRSAHYYVITNGMRLTADELQSITHSFCYAYARATKGVSYCAPAYYADRLCDRGRAWLRHWITNQAGAPYQPYRAFRRLPANPNETVLEYNTDIAQHLSTDAYFAPHQGTPRQYGDARKNPWHANLDRCMFYL